ncbi:(d)CMP kinase [Acidipila sp. EB88]|uniref:(d)CMP kinase n=1 Tax=Acidipila sp. EB88 TaxID=2305226 RepID=UPI000F5D8661|nr:(d)CMP kinase [Acidipila sp. EB88]RRA48689.1 (d)CMP kinase [Acidipila sp. EB88]
MTQPSQSSSSAPSADHAVTQTSGGTPPDNRILAIDGPAGAGKSTVAARMAQRFGLLKIETGAMYRAFALKALQNHVDLEDEPALTRLSQHTRIELLPAETGNRVLLDGSDVTAQLRTTEISEAASRVSVHGPIRAWMVDLQQQLGARIPQGIVMEGRDIGTVVFPQASLKIYLSATPEARTERRLAQEHAGVQGSAADAANLLEAMRARDLRDSSRAESPLRPAADAVEIDSTRLSLDEVIERASALVCERWQITPQLR